MKYKKIKRGEEKEREEKTSPQSFSPFLVRARAPAELLCNFQSLRIQVLIKAPWGTAHNITLQFQALWKDAPRGLWLKFLKCRHCKKGTPGEFPPSIEICWIQSIFGALVGAITPSGSFFFYFFTKHVLLTCWQIAQWSVRRMHTAGHLGGHGFLPNILYLRLHVLYITPPSSPPREKRKQ